MTCPKTVVGDKQIHVVCKKNDCLNKCIPMAVKFNGTKKTGTKLK